jgi:hypothetical protein
MTRQSSFLGQRTFRCTPFDDNFQCGEYTHDQTVTRCGSSTLGSAGKTGGAIKAGRSLALMF